MSTRVLVISFVLLGLATLLGLRLARVALRNRRLPDALMAAFFLSGGTVGYGCLVLRRALPDLSPAASGFLRQLGDLGLVVPALVMAVFTWCVFRPHDGWARFLALLLAGVIALDASVARWLLPALGWPGAAARELDNPWFVAATLAKAVALGWGSLEASLYWRMARRRLALGLADPLVSNRFLLWSIWSGAAFAILVLRVSWTVVGNPADPTVALPPAVLFGQMGAGILCFGAIWLTFSPPAFYRRLVEAAPV